ncbi:MULTISPECIES: type II toxin-antitoxin system RelE/ParE family toxin [unclassified Microcoleus]|uniref:type II toxin-antitoxin system RelE/ParE family toxin n=1 Tax=unclassified Microcoleus TaxID=2642155 RepID=UPI0025E2D32F|nr:MULTISPECIES: type II toxin-antitoxin system RelE/ParE family toxin [unclassified Microcoleus]
MEVQPREIRRYITSDGRNPFAEWLSSLRNLKAVVKIEQRLDRVRLGNLGNSKPVGEGVWELKIDFGPGYRVYFGQVGSTIVLILCGGDKSTQEQDIRKAYEYWKEYGERKNANER